MPNEDDLYHRILKMEVRLEEFIRSAERRFREQSTATWALVGLFASLLIGIVLALMTGRA